MIVAASADAGPMTEKELKYRLHQCEKLKGEAALGCVLVVEDEFKRRLIEDAKKKKPAKIIELTALDFVVDWPKYVGSQVVVRGGKVVGAGDDVSFLKVPGRLVYLKPPWHDRNDLRFILTHCLAASSGDECLIDVSGIVGRFHNREEPMLSPVDFLLR